MSSDNHYIGKHLKQQLYFDEIYISFHATVTYTGMTLYIRTAQRAAVVRAALTLFPRTGPLQTRCKETE